MAPHCVNSHFLDHHRERFSRFIYQLSLRWQTEPGSLACVLGDISSNPSIELFTLAITILMFQSSCLFSPSSFFLFV